MGDIIIEFPEPKYVPPQLPEYQFQEALVPNDPPEILKVVELPGQIVVGLADIFVGAVELVFTFTVTLAHDVVLQSPSALT